MVVPTGDENAGASAGTVIVEPMLLVGQLLPRGWFVHGQAGFGLPLDSDEAEDEAFWRLAAGRAITEGRWGRRWAPMVEVLGSRGEDGEVIATLPEQMPYLEWEHSDYPGRETCQSCHMPVVEEETPVSGVLGEPRQGVSQHVFRGGNFFMMRMLNRYRGELGVTAAPRDLEEAARRTIRASAERIRGDRGGSRPRQRHLARGRHPHPQ